MGFVFGRYPAGDDINGAGPSLDAEIEQEDKPHGNSLHDVADDVRAALFDSNNTHTAETQEAWKSWVDECQKDGVDPVRELDGFHKLDAAAHHDPRYVSAAVEQINMRGRFVRPEVKETGDPHVDAARAAVDSLKGGYGRFNEVAEQVGELDKRHVGGFSNYVANVSKLKSDIRSGTPTEKLAAAVTALSRYDAWAGSDPGQVQATYDLKRIEKMLPQLDPEDHRYDPQLRQKTAQVLGSDRSISKDWNAYQQVAYAMQKARRG